MLILRCTACWQWTKKHPHKRSFTQSVLFLQSRFALPALDMGTALLSQRELAGRLGLKEQQIQRYEAVEYASASLSRVSAVIQSLNVEVREEVSFAETFSAQTELKTPKTDDDRKEI